MSLPAPGTGRFHHYTSFESKFVGPRRVEVWLPPDYEMSRRHYPVIYAQDGQNLFDPSTAYVGIDWGLQDAVARLSHEDPRYGAIIVGVWNTPLRIPEYMPQKPLMGLRYRRIRDRFVERYGSAPISDNYLRFLITELKPEIDRSYRSKRESEATILLGSSMGGLLSVYGFCEYPAVIGKAVCMSTSWTIGGKAVISYLKTHIPQPSHHRIYFDYGSEAQIGAYEKLQHETDRLFHKSGYRRDVHFMVQRFPGDSHSEAAWRDRVEVPLRFVLGGP